MFVLVKFASAPVGPAHLAPFIHFLSPFFKQLAAAPERFALPLEFVDGKAAAAVTFRDWRKSELRINERQKKKKNQIK